MTVNPITLEVVRNALVAYAEEMANSLCKSAYNMMIYEVRDFCCGHRDQVRRHLEQVAEHLVAQFRIVVGAKLSWFGL